MNRILKAAGLAVLAAALLGACQTPAKAGDQAAKPAPAASTAKAGPAADLGPVSGTDCNTLAETVGPVTITVTRDVSVTPEKSPTGASLTLVDFAGEKALKVTRNENSQIRVAFVLDKPVKLTDFKTLEYSVAGFEGYAGSYNCGLIFKDIKQGAERLGAFYTGNILKDEWTDYSLDLYGEEVWGNNYNEGRELVAIQFWSDNKKPLYITKVALKK